MCTVKHKSLHTVGVRSKFAILTLKGDFQFNKEAFSILLRSYDLMFLLRLAYMLSFLKAFSGTKYKLIPIVYEHNVIGDCCLFYDKVTRLVIMKFTGLFPRKEGRIRKRLLKISIPHRLIMGFFFCETATGLH